MKNQPKFDIDEAVYAISLYSDNIHAAIFSVVIVAIYIDKDNIQYSIDSYDDELDGMREWDVTVPEKDISCNYNELLIKLEKLWKLS